jgi:Uncharacterized protein involved in exopolysaccharide biosynthesis
MIRRDELHATVADKDGWAFAEALARRGWVLVALPFAFGVLAYAATFLMAPEYTATTSFVTDARDRTPTLGGFSGLASQLGVGMGSSPTSSPQFFADVLRSTDVMTGVLSSRIPSGGRDSVLVLDVYDTGGGTPDERMERAVRTLRRKLSANVNPRTSIIEMSVSAPAPKLAVAIAQRFVAVLNRFNLETRQSQAAQRRRFTGDRLHEVQDSLARAEAMQTAFLQTNRSFQNAPALAAQYDRITRQISTYQEMYSTLRREYETARVDEINDTPVITIIERATPPVHPSSPRRMVYAVAGAMLGGFLALALILVLAYREEFRRARPVEYSRLVAILRRTLRPATARRRTAP